jgi:thiol-disulfide isomerase/thioredoxin
VEKIFWLGILVFAVVRLGPQVGAWLGVGPTLGAVPDFRVETLGGVEVDDDSLRGHVTIVNFWATWCPPCRVEIPALQRLHEDFADAGLVVLGLSTDAGGVAEVSAFLEERGVSYPVAMADPATRRAFGGVSALPTTFILDREGVIRHRVFGFFAPPAMRAAVQRLLEEEATPGPAPRGTTAVPSGHGFSAHDPDQPVAKARRVGGGVGDGNPIDLQDHSETGLEVEALDLTVEELPHLFPRRADLQTLALGDPGTGGGFPVDLEDHPLALAGGAGLGGRARPGSGVGLRSGSRRRLGPGGAPGEQGNQHGHDHTDGHSRASQD